MIENRIAKQIESVHPVNLTSATNDALLTYFRNTWELYENLFSSIKAPQTYFLSPDPLRNPLIFYWGHTAAFYINKIVMAGLLEKGINPAYEKLFAMGVDPDLPENLEVTDIWPSVEQVNAYRSEVHAVVSRVIESVTIEGNINDTSPVWSILMGIEHDRIHFETSSVLIRQLPVHLLACPNDWNYAHTNGCPPENITITMTGGTIRLGKPKSDDLFGWDNEYGNLEVDVAPFEATQNLVSNAEYLEFVLSGSYNNPQYWSPEGQEWKYRVNARHPKFWLRKRSGYAYRAMFNEIPMPMDWPVEVNAHEAFAYCQWKGDGWRLMTEAEFTLIAKGDTTNTIPEPMFNSYCNLNMAFGSPTPVGYMNAGRSKDGFNDIYGNVWDWLSNDFYPLPGFEIHPLYTEFSKPFFDEEHSMLLGGSWATTGTGASQFYRLWFRRHFFQHAGFRLARSL